MKIDEAIEQLKYDMAMCKFDSATGKAFVSLDCQKAYEADKLAIKSLEAWEKVKAEMLDQMDDDDYWLGLNLAIQIIDEHLKEVSE